VGYTHKEMVDLSLLFVNICELQCLYEAGKGNEFHVLDLLCEALDPEFYASRAPGSFTQETGHTKASSPNDCFTHQHKFTMRKNGFISQAMRKVR